MESQPTQEDLLTYWAERRRATLEALAVIDHKTFMLGYITTNDTLFDDEEDWIVRGEE